MVLPSAREEQRRRRAVRPNPAIASSGGRRWALRRLTTLACGVLLAGILAPLIAQMKPAAAGSNSASGSSWAGFSLEDTSPKNLTAATSSWVVPQVTCKAGENSRSAEWVGLGGDFYSFFQKILGHVGYSRFEPLYQAGSDSDCSNGQPTYDAWEEVYAFGQYKPAIPLQGRTVEAGDTMSVSLTFNAKQHTGRWVVSDSRAGAPAWTQPGTWTKTPAGFHTAECIVEDPLLRGGKRAALANFTIVPFNGCHTASSVGHADATSTSLPGHWTRKAITMKIASKVLAVPAYDPLRVTQGDLANLPASTLLALFDHAVLPAGICQASGQEPSGPIAISPQNTPQANGVLIGAVGTEGTSDYYAATVDTPTPVDFNNHRANEVAAAVWCSEGATAAWSGTYVFSSIGGSNWRIDNGPMLTRTYEPPGGTNDFGTGAESVSAAGHTLVINEEYGEPGDCGGCASGKATTTWGWTQSDPDHLVMDNPAPSELTVKTAVIPSALGGGNPVGNQFGPKIAAGASTLVECTGEFNGDGSLWVELDTGAWIPASDASGTLPADCDGQPFTQATPCPASEDTAFMAAVLANPPPDSSNSATVTNAACAGNWALASGQLSFGPGGGPSEGWFAAFSNSSGQWTAVAGPDDGTCLLQPTLNGCPDGAGGPVWTAPPLTTASLVAVSGLEFDPDSGTVTPAGVSPGSN